MTCAINTEVQRRLVLNAEGDREVVSKPDWCSLSQMSGSKKTELTLTIHQMAAGSPMREGEIVFRLKDKDYTHKCTVRQYDYQYAEDEIVKLQSATRGNNGGINIFIVGDGYDAVGHAVKLCLDGELAGCAAAHEPHHQAQGCYGKDFVHSRVVWFFVVRSFL